MGAAVGSKGIVVLSDNDKLARALQLNLCAHWPVSLGRLADPALPVVPAGEFGLIILALSSPASEPIVALNRAALLKYIGSVPLLIISDRPFQPSPDQLIIHLDFPFQSGALVSRVQEIMQGTP